MITDTAIIAASLLVALTGEGRDVGLLRFLLSLCEAAYLLDTPARAFLATCLRTIEGDVSIAESTLRALLAVLGNQEADSFMRMLEVGRGIPVSMTRCMLTNSCCFRRVSLRGRLA